MDSDKATFQVYNLTMTQKPHNWIELQCSSPLVILMFYSIKIKIENETLAGSIHHYFATSALVGAKSRNQLLPLSKSPPAASNAATHHSSS